jgi:hypothetical protein
MRRLLGFAGILFAAVLAAYLGLKPAPAAPNGMVLIVQGDPSTSPGLPRSRLISLDVRTGQKQTLLECVGCDRPLLSPDGQTLYLVRVDEDGQHTEGDNTWTVFTARLVRVDLATGSVKEGPIFSRSGLSWGWKPDGISPDGRYLLMDIPNNDIHAKENPLHAHPGVARYDLKEDRLLPEPFVSGFVGTHFLPASGGKIYGCCLVEGPKHPLPGVTVLGEAGQREAQVAIPAQSHEVHPTRLIPAGDGRRLYALRAGTDQYWVIDPTTRDVREGTLAQSGWKRLLSHLVPVAEAKGPTDLALGEAVVHGKRIFSSLYLAHMDFRDGKETIEYRKGGGIRVISLPGFRQVAHLVPDRTFESLAVSPDGKTVYAADSEAGELLAFDAESGKETGRWQVGGRPIRVLIPRPNTTPSLD